MSSPESKYPSEPLPRLLLPDNYLYHPLYFEAEEVRSHTARSARPHTACSRGPPLETAAVGERDIYRELNFSLQDASELPSNGGEKRDGVGLARATPHELCRSGKGHQHTCPRREESSQGSCSERVRPSRGGSTNGIGASSPQSRSCCAALPARVYPTTRSAQLREHFMLQKSLERLEEQERKQLEPSIATRELPTPLEDDVDEHMLRPTRAAQLRNEFVARKLYNEEEARNNIYFVKGQDTGRGSSARVLQSLDDSSANPGRLTKAAQLLRERTMQRMKELEEAQERRRREEESLDAPFQPRRVSSVATGSRLGESTRSTVPSVSRPNRTEELRRQHIAERECELESERAKEQAARDAILRGPRRSSRVGRREDTKPQLSNIVSVAPISSQERGEHKELRVSSVNSPLRAAARKLPARPAAQPTSDAPNISAAPTIGRTKDKPSSPTSSSSSSIIFYVEVVQAGKDANPNVGCALEQTCSGAEETTGDWRQNSMSQNHPRAPSRSTLAARSIPGAHPNAAASESGPALAKVPATELGSPLKEELHQPDSSATVIDLTPIVPQGAALAAPTTAHSREQPGRHESDEAAAPAWQNAASVASCSTIDTAIVDPSQAQADLLRRLRESANSSSLSNGDAAPIRVAVLFTSANGRGGHARVERQQGSHSASSLQRRVDTEGPVVLSSGASDADATSLAAATATGAVGQRRRGRERRILYSTRADCRKLCSQLDEQLLRRFFVRWAAQPRRQRQTPELETACTPALSTVESAGVAQSSLTSVPETSSTFSKGPGGLRSSGQPLAFPDFSSRRESEFRPEAVGGSQRRSTQSRGEVLPCEATAEHAAAPHIPQLHHSSLFPRTPVDSVLVPELQESRTRREDKSVSISHAGLVAAGPADAKAAFPASWTRDLDLVDSMLPSTALFSASASPYAHAKPVSQLRGPGIFLAEAEKVPPTPVYAVPSWTHAPAADPAWGDPEPLSIANKPSRAATPPRDVGRREPPPYTRKAPKPCSLPPSDLLRAKGTQTPADGSLMNVPTTTGTTDATISPRREAAVQHSPPCAPRPAREPTTGSTSVPTVASTGVPTTTAKGSPPRNIPPPQPASPPTARPAEPSVAGRRAPMGKRGADCGVSVRPRGALAARAATSRLESAAAQRTGALSASSPLPVVVLPTEPHKKTRSPATPEPMAEETETVVRTPEDANGTPLVEAKVPKTLSESSMSLPTPRQASPPQLAASSLEHSGAEGNSHHLDNSFVPYLEEPLMAASKRSLGLEGGQPGSHAPTPVRATDNLMAAPQSSPPPRPSHRAASSDVAGDTSDGHRGPVRLMLPELSMPRSDSASVPRPILQRLPSVTEERKTEERQPISPAFSSTIPSSSPSSSLASSHFSFSTGPQQLGPESNAAPPSLPPMHVEEERVDTGSDDPVHPEEGPSPVGTAGPAAALPNGNSDLFDTSSSLHDSWADDGAVAKDEPSVAGREDKVRVTTAVPLSGSHHVDPQDKRDESPVVGALPSATDHSTPISLGESIRQVSHPLKPSESRGDGGVADELLSLDERPHAPVPLESGSSETLGGRATGVTAWSAVSPMELNASAGSPLLSEQGGTDDLMAAFGRKSASISDSPPLKPRYYHREF